MSCRNFQAMFVLTFMLYGGLNQVIFLLLLYYKLSKKFIAYLLCKKLEIRLPSGEKLSTLDSEHN